MPAFSKTRARQEEPEQWPQIPFPAKGNGLHPPNPDRPGNEGLKKRSKNPLGKMLMRRSGEDGHTLAEALFFHQQLLGLATPSS